MGRYDFRPQNVLPTANQLLATKRITQRPPWMDIVQDIPPSAMLTRPVLRDSSHKPSRALSRKGKKASKTFQPIKLVYEEDSLRRTFFSDHPWELARPRVLNEESGDEWRGWDWSKGIRQGGKRLDGESVIQRQLHLISTHNITKSHAYDIARREYYSARHIDAVETRVAREEAMAYGAYFGQSAIEISQGLEDAQFEDWKTWALAQVERERQIAGSAYSGEVVEEDVSEKVADPVFEVVEEVPAGAAATP